MLLYSLYMKLCVEMHNCVMHKCADRNGVSVCFALTVLRSCVQSLRGCLRSKVSLEGYRASTPWWGSC